MIAGDDLGHGYRDHGIATPLSNHRGTVATCDGAGRDVVLLWLYDHRGGYACLVIDALNGDTTEVPMPFDPGQDCPFASILSSRNRFYTHFNSHFVEFDPTCRSFTFCHSTAPQMSMGMTEDDEGRIWSVSYPDSGVVRYDPGTGEFTDFGPVYAQNWRQYQRHVAADDAGWIYFGVGNTVSQVVALNPADGTARPLLDEPDRVAGASGFVERDEDGYVYALPATGGEATSAWMKLHGGEVVDVGVRPSPRPKATITDSQSLFHATFPSGRILRRCDPVERDILVEDPDARQSWRHRFDYTSEGAHLMGVTTSPGGGVCGGTAFPMRFFHYDPGADTWTNHASYGQWNTVVAQGDRVFVGGYTGGFLLEWDPAAPWVATDVRQQDTNPGFLAACAPTINRPHALLAHDNGQDLILAGTPGYGYTGGGLLFWNRVTKTSLLREHKELIPEHSTMSLIALHAGRLLGGTTVAPGTGGERKADLAELYELDLETKRITWHAPVLPGVAEYTALTLAAEGVVFGIADRTRFFVFDPESRSILQQYACAETFGPTAYQQGPRLFVASVGGQDVYLLFERGIARVGPAPDFELHLVSQAPVVIQRGGDWFDGRIYFASGSHLYSWDAGSGRAPTLDPAPH